MITIGRAIFTFAVVLVWSAVVLAVDVERQSNIVLILADDVGREILGCYGGTSYQTPNIDRLAAAGARCRHTYAMPVCHPTRTTLLTGQYPFRLGHPEWGTFPGAEENRTLPAILHDAGYATAIAGKWQLALLKNDLKQPHRMGFDAYCLYGWHEGPWYYQPHVWQDGKLRSDFRDRYGPDVICDYVIDFMTRNKHRRFFAFYSMELCHSETNDLATPAPVGPNGRYDTYAEMVENMDRCVGRVVAALDRLGLRENTLILFTSDNGTAQHTLADSVGDTLTYESIVSKMGDREIPGGKGTLSDWGTRVPMIIHWPGKIEPGQVIDELIDMSDILPSLADVAAAELPSGVKMDGHAVTTLTRRFAPPREWVFAEHKGSCFVRSRRWKLYNDGRFYDMQNDADEKRSIPGDARSGEAAIAHDKLSRALAELKYVKPGSASNR